MSKKILVLGGYGFGNTGDEAELNETIKMLSSNFQEYEIKVLTPNINYTFSQHKCMVGSAPRETFFDLSNEKTLYSLRNKQEKFLFLLKSFLIYTNCYLNKKIKFPFLLHPKKIAAIYDLMSSSLVYYCGGGYLTGSTLSRLWDGCLYTMLANLYKIPVVMSGQTIGLWRNKVDRFLTKHAFKKVEYITLRDTESSFNDLMKIDVKKDRVEVMFDDALFCDTLSKQEHNELINSLGLNTLEEYITFNIHYWGIENEEQKRIHLEKLKNIFDIMLEIYNKKIIFIPMHPVDEQTINDFFNLYNPKNSIIFKYDYCFKKVRSIIGHSELCVTQKHHPIIFAVGEKVPVISLSFRQYYKHKNEGALSIFGISKYNVEIENDNMSEIFKSLCMKTKNEKSIIVRNLSKKLIELAEKKNSFIIKVKDIVKC